jgi:hypothetical protein
MLRVLSMLEIFMRTHRPSPIIHGHDAGKTDAVQEATSYARG